MTTAEAVRWSESQASNGWLVQFPEETGAWRYPGGYSYDDDISKYRRAKLKQHGQGIDKSTIQRLMTEEQ
jgi:hypothetical protein